MQAGIGLCISGVVANLAAADNLYILERPAAQPVARPGDRPVETRLRVAPFRRRIGPRQVEGQQFQSPGLGTVDADGGVVPLHLLFEQFNDLLPDLFGSQQLVERQSAPVDHLQFRDPLAGFLEQAGVRDRRGGHGGQGFEQLQVGRLEGALRADATDADDADGLVPFLERGEHDRLRFQVCAGNLHRARVVEHVGDDLRLAAGRHKARHPFAYFEFQVGERGGILQHSQHAPKRLAVWFDEEDAAAVGGKQAPGALPR